MRRRFRFWLIYGVAWLPFAASYFALFVTHLGRPFFDALKGSLFNVLPAALFGVGVVIACQHLPWSPHRRSRFLLVHLGLASLYVALWTIAAPLLNALDQMIEHGSWNYQRASSFQGGFITALMIYL